jgi:beta-galactosidase/beta-glucuronidase
MGGNTPTTPQTPTAPGQSQGIASQYMNPYLQGVLDPQMAELRRQNDITNMGSNAKMTQAGAFGGSRQAIMNAENNRNLMQEMNKTVGAGYANAYDKAQQQFNTEQTQGRSLADLMAQQGAAQRGIESEGMAADKASFEGARENPYKMLQFQQSMLNGLPVSATSYNIAQPTKAQEILAGAAGGAKAVGTNNKTVADLLQQLGL